MGYSSNNIDTGALYFGSVNPTVTGQEVDNDSFIVTSDGTPTGTPISFWKFDEETLTWVQVPSGSTCPAPMTRAALITLRNANGLTKDCDYVITDHVQGRLVAGTTIHLQAVSANELSQNVSVNTTYDNEAWAGIYDIDRGLVLELKDNRNNVARGFNGTEVANFDWGNAAYTNVLVDSSTLTATIGATHVITNVRIEKGSIVTLTGFTGQLNNSNIDIVSIVNLTNANGTWRYFEIKDNSTLNASGYTGGGDNYYNTIDRTSNVNFSNSSSGVVLRQNTLSGATITHSGVSTGTFTLTTSRVESSTITHSAGAGNFSATGNNQFLSNANISHSTGTMTLSNVHNYSSVIQQTTNAGAVMSLTQVNVKQASNISNQATGTLTMTRSDVEHSSSVRRQAGATGTLAFNNSRASGGSNIAHTATNTGNSTITSCIFDASTLTNNSATVMNPTRVYVKGSSSITSNNGAAGTMSISDTELLGSATITKLPTSTAGTMSISGGTVINSASFIQTAGTGNLTISSAEISGSSAVNITAGNRNYNFTRLIQTGVSRANLSGTGAAITDTHNEFEMHYRATYTNSCSGTANAINYCEVSGLSGTLSLTGTTGGSNINRVKLKDGTFNKANNPNSGTYQLWNISDAGVVTLTNHAASEIINYIDVSNQSNITINRTGLGTISVVQVRNGGTVNITGTSTTISRLDVEQGSLNISAGSISNVSKKMSSVFTINGGVQTQVYHWSATNKTTTVNNTNRVDYLGVVSTAPIL